MGFLSAKRKTHGFFAPDYWETNRLRRVEAKRATELAEQILVRFGLRMSESREYSKRKSDKFIVIVPAQNIPAAVLATCLNNGRPQAGKGFRDRSLNAVVFHADHAFAPFIDALREYLEPKQEVML